MSPSALASRRQAWSLPRRSRECAGGTTATILTDTTIGETTLGAPTGIRIGTGATIIMTGTAGKTEGSG
jgi:hypothetical protein